MSGVFHQDTLTVTITNAEGETFRSAGSWLWDFLGQCARKDSSLTLDSQACRVALEQVVKPATDSLCPGCSSVSRSLLRPVGAIIEEKLGQVAARFSESSEPQWRFLTILWRVVSHESYEQSGILRWREVLEEMSRRYSPAGENVEIVED